MEIDDITYSCANSVYAQENMFNAIMLLKVARHTADDVTKSQIDAAISYMDKSIKNIEFVRGINDKLREVGWYYQALLRKNGVRYEFGEPGELPKLEGETLFPDEQKKHT